MRARVCKMQYGECMHTLADLVSIHRLSTIKILNFYFWRCTCSEIILLSKLFAKYSHLRVWRCLEIPDLWISVSQLIPESHRSGWHDWFAPRKIWNGWIRMQVGWRSAVAALGQPVSTFSNSKVKTAERMDGLVTIVTSARRGNIWNSYRLDWQHKRLCAPGTPPWCNIHTFSGIEFGIGHGGAPGFFKPIQTTRDTRQRVNCLIINPIHVHRRFGSLGSA